MEEWKDVKGYEGLYKAHINGDIEGPTGTILKTYDNGRGYLTVTLYKDRKGAHKYVHRLIAEAFIPNPDNKKYVDHIDTNRKNNCVANLRWVTGSENRNNPITRERQFDSQAKIFFNGVSATKIAFDNGISNDTVWHRLKNGWLLEDAITVPKGNRRPKVTSEVLTTASECAI